MQPSPLDQIARSVAERYRGDRRLLTFEELIAEFGNAPYLLSRSSEQYLRDSIEHFGSYPVPGIGGEMTRWRLFDGDPENGIPALIGQEEAQRDVVETIAAAAREGRLDRMLVLHGPNGSGKSSLVELLQRALEEYSHEPDGALYALRWIFPKTPAEGSDLGFGGGRSESDPDSYALLEPEDVAARIICELRCNPLFVVPDSQREGMLEEPFKRSPELKSESFRQFMNGNLCPRCKQVYEALLAAYKGDWRRVVRHVQVERVFISRRFRMGAVVTQPQGTADAQLRLVSGDAGVAGLPAFLQSQSLFEVMGDLADANRGILEFSDFLKRNLELSKYLLQTTEKGFVTVGNRLLELDVVFLATANERHLEAFKQLPEFASFQARMAFVRIPYLRESEKEIGIYRSICKAMERSRHVSPHVAELSALFAVLTRLHRPQKENFDDDVAELVTNLSPIEKAYLYSDGRLPDRLDGEARKTLRNLIPAIRDEYQHQQWYEGRVGASAREMRAALMQAAVRDTSPCVSPSAVLEQLSDMISDPSLYRFLQVEPQGTYHDAKALLRAVTHELGQWILGDVQDAMELVPEDEYDRRFDEYFQHVVAEIQGSNVFDANTGKRVPADGRLLDSVEALLPITGPIDEYRRDLVSRIGAYALDHPDEQPLDFRSLFPDLLRALRRNFFEERRGVVEKVQTHVLLIGTPAFDDLTEADRQAATRTLTNLTNAQVGYCDHCAKDAVHVALAHLRERANDD
jgi:predicted Ser/Thr protein kinase